MAFRKFFGRRDNAGGGTRFAADWLIVGLGNPGEKHVRDRHNAGFWVINDLAKRAATQPKMTGSMMAIGLGTLAGARVALVKPKTFMNASGKAVRQAQQWANCGSDRTVIVYDDLDLGVGALRIRWGEGGTGGHNGIKSIVNSVGGDFIKVRIGIGRPLAGGEPTWAPEEIAAYVLGAPHGEDRRIMDETARLAADAIETIIREGPEMAGNRYNRKEPAKAGAR